MSSQNQSLLARDAAAFFWQAGSTPCLAGIRRAEGIWLEDLAGHRFMDFHGNSTHHLGYGHPRLIAALVEQLRDLPFTPRRFTDEPAVALAEALTARWPGGEGRVLLATGGSDAIEIAVKIARAATGRYKTISLYGSYHGSGFGALSFGGRYLDRTPRIGPLLPGALHVPPFYPTEPHLDEEQAARLSLDSLAVAFRHEVDIAAVLAEPIRSSAQAPPAWYWPEVRRLCDRYGSLLLFDEIPTGLGKTGHFFVSEAVGVRPDLTVLGKALGGGVLPIAAVIGRADLDRARDLTLGHYTHEKNPVTARAALTTLAIIEEEGLVERARALGALGLDRLQALARRLPLVRRVRGHGLLLALDLEAEAAGDLAEALAGRLLARGLNLSASAAGTLVLSPPLVVSAEELGRALDLVEESLSEIS